MMDIERLKTYQAWIVWALEHAEPKLELNFEDLIWFKAVLDEAINLQSVTNEPENFGLHSSSIDHNSVIDTVEDASMFVNALEQASQKPMNKQIKEAIRMLENFNIHHEQQKEYLTQEEFEKTVDYHCIQNNLLAITALQECQPWTSVDAEKPKSGEHVLLNIIYNNRQHPEYDKIVKGFYAEELSIKEETWSDYTGNEDYCEEDDSYYVCQGWYSFCDFVEEFSYIDIPSGFTVTHWKPLAQPPKRIKR